jgi:hypothetical protein
MILLSERALSLSYYYDYRLPTGSLLGLAGGKGGEGQALRISVTGEAAERLIFFSTLTADGRQTGQRHAGHGFGHSTGTGTSYGFVLKSCRSLRTCAEVPDTRPGMTCDGVFYCKLPRYR